MVGPLLFRLGRSLAGPVGRVVAVTAAGRLGTPDLRDECRAHVFTVGECREPLDVDAQETREPLGLGLADLRELGGDVLERTMPLSQLNPFAGGVHSHGAGRCGVPVGREGIRQGPGAIKDLRTGGTDDRGVTRLQACDMLVGELGDGGLPHPLGDETQRRGGDLRVHRR